LSDVNWRGWDDRVRHFIARVKLDNTPPRLLPFMSASVEIDTGRVMGALVIPVTAMKLEGGRHCCYVLGAAVPERRLISTRHATADLLEVCAGLRPGERVVVQPNQIDQPSRPSGSSGNGLRGGWTWLFGIGWLGLG
jgi:hypothetical protein